MVDDRAHRFERLHRNGNCFIMANAWNAGSAVILEQAGFEAVGTTSAGIAYSHGLADAVSALSFDAALRETREIAAAVDIPVSMDSENGYADDPAAVFDNFRRIAASGVVGASIEDYSGDPQDPFYDLELAVERVRAAKESVAQPDCPFVLTARAECYLYGHTDPFKESVKRINRYRAAGADCLYVPGIRDIQTIRELVTATDGPINVVSSTDRRNTLSLDEKMRCCKCHAENEDGTRHRKSPRCGIAGSGVNRLMRLPMPLKPVIRQFPKTLSASVVSVHRPHSAAGWR